MITLYQNWFSTQDPARNDELARVQTMNLGNRLIDRIVYFAEKLPPIHSKIMTIDSMPHPTYNDIFKVINEITELNDINIVANLDIAFNETIKFTSHLEHNHVYALTRHEFHGKFVQLVGHDSQDAWCFKGFVRPLNADFQMGKRGCDNRLAHELFAAGYEVSNPSLSIIINHKHANQHRTYWDDMIPGPYLAVPMSYIPGLEPKPESKPEEPKWHKNIQKHITKHVKQRIIKRN